MPFEQGRGGVVAGDHDDVRADIYQLGQGLVPTTGDISRGAFGMWIEKGEITYPVAEITISGNLGDILNNIQMVGNDLKFKRSINGPTVLVEGITIGGK